MIQDFFKNSLVIPQQLPSFVRNEKDYQVFISFLQAYYEFLGLDGNVEERGKNLLNYNDVDKTIDEFEEYFFNEFLQYFPKDSLTDKREIVKHSRELYQRKATPASFKFLMRSLYNSYCDTINTRDYLLIASDGKWNISTYIRIESLDSRFLSLKFNKIIGETSRATAKIERSQVLGNKTEIFLSDISGSFISGEYIRVVDDILNEKLFDGEILRSKIVGAVKRIVVDSNYRGLNYKVDDPVLIIGGIASEIVDPEYATAEVGSVTLGSLKSIVLVDGSNGYRTYPNSVITITGGGGSGAEARITAVDNTNPAIVSNLPIDIISPYANTYVNSTFTFATTANANTRLIDAFNFAEFTTYPISEIELLNPGIGYSTSPIVAAETIISDANTRQNLGSFGILAPLEITYSGYNYSNGDIITITGGGGIGAYANVKSVGSNGEIISVQYIYDANNAFPLGGFGYSNDNLPSATVDVKTISLTANNSSEANSNTLYFAATTNVKVGMYISGNGISNNITFGYFPSNTTITKVESGYLEISTNLSSNTANGDVYTINGTALLSVPSILGTGAEFAATTDTIGEVLSIDLLTSGDQYSFVPEVSLKVLDLIVYDINELYFPEDGDVIYQGSADTPSFTSKFYSIEIIDFNPVKRLYKLRLYNYDGFLNSEDLLYIDKEGSNSKTLSFTVDVDYNSGRFSSGVLFYGNGTARATAELIEGSVNLKGGYLNNDGFLSDSNYLQSEVFNFYSYFLLAEKSFADFKDAIYGVLHPAGKQVIPYNLVERSASIETNAISKVPTILSFNTLYSSPTAYGVFEEPNKFVIYNSPAGVITEDNFPEGYYLRLISSNQETFVSQIDSVDSANDVIYFKDSMFLELPNVAYGYTSSNSAIVTSLTGTYDLINNGEYSNTSNYLYDIVYANDSILIANNSYLTIDVIDYSNRIIYANTDFNVSGNTDNPNLITIKRTFICNSDSILLVSPPQYVSSNGDFVAIEDAISKSFETSNIETSTIEDVVSITTFTGKEDTIETIDTLSISVVGATIIDSINIPDSASKTDNILIFDLTYQDYANSSYFEFSSNTVTGFQNVYVNTLSKLDSFAVSESVVIRLNGSIVYSS